MKFIILLAFVFSSVSCASYFKRKDCEKSNWFNHGKSVALKGIRIDADEWVNSCKKVEANINWAELDLGFKSGMAQYCTDTGARSTGKKGDFLNLDLCDESKGKMLKKNHAEGVAEFCQFDSAVAKASTGWAYNNICPKNLEPEFMKGYKKGRKNYLLSEIEQRQSKIRNLEDEMRQLSYQEADRQMELRRLPIRSRYRKQKDENGFEIEDPMVARREEVQREISRISGDISRKRSEKSQYENEIINLKRELRTLDSQE